MMKYLHIIFLTFLSIFFGNYALAADESMDRIYDLTSHGQLHLPIPKGWNEELRKHPGDFPPTIFISGFEGSPFVVFVTPRWSDVNDSHEFGTPKSIHEIVAKAAAAAAPESVEGKLSIVTMGGGQGPGYYFDATDKAPKPGDFTYMTQGAIGVGKLVCTFTILTNDKKSPVKNKALTMVTRASWRAGK